MPIRPTCWRPTSELGARGIETIRVERGGEVTYHGPGQLVAYPIVRLADAGLLLRPFVRALELAMADAARQLRRGRRATRRVPRLLGGPGGAMGLPRKLGALGLRVEHGVTYHGIALNVTTAPRRLRAHRPMRAHGHHGHLHRPGAGLDGHRRRALDHQRRDRRRALRGRPRGQAG